MKIIAIRMMSSKFTLKDHQLEQDVTINVNPKILLKPHFNDPKDNSQEGSLVLGILIDQDDIPFRIEVKYQAEFTLNDDAEITNAEKFARLNLAAMLFPYIRCEISDRTTKGGFQPLFLQPLNFVAMYKEFESNKQLNEANELNPTESLLSHDTVGNHKKGQKGKSK